MNDIVLHSYRRCPFAIRVRMCLEEKELKYTIKEEKLSALSAELLHLHPEGKVPLMIHGPNVIYESSIITEYLDEAFPSVRLMPEGPALRAQVRLQTYVCNTIYKPDLDSYKYGWDDLSGSDRNSLLSRLKNYLESLDRSIERWKYLVCDTLTLADIHVFPFYRQLQRTQKAVLDLSPYTSLNEWSGQMSLKPSFVRAMTVGHSAVE